MTVACYCGRCYGCRLAHEAGEYYREEEDPRELEEQERAEELACYVEPSDDDELHELDGVGPLPVELHRRSGDLPSSPKATHGATS